MILQEAKITEVDLLNSLWWLWCNDKLGSCDIKSCIEDLDLQIEFITFSGYKFTSNDKKTTYSYDRKQKENS